MPSPPLPEAIEKALIAYRESNYQTVDDNGKRVRRAIAAAIENTKADTFQIMVDGLSISGKQATMIQTLTAFVQQHRKQAAALEAGE